MDEIYDLFNALNNAERKEFCTIVLRFKRIEEYLKKKHLSILMPVIYQLYRYHIYFKRSRLEAQRIICIYLGAIIAELHTLTLAHHKMDFWDIAFVVMGALPVAVSAESIVLLINNLKEHAWNGW